MAAHIGSPASQVRAGGALALFILGTESSWRSEERYSVLKLDKLHNLKVPAVDEPYKDKDIEDM